MTRHTAGDLGDLRRPLKGRTGPGASVAAFCGVIGNVLAWEVTRLLIGPPPLLAGRWSEIDLDTLDVRRRDIPRSADCTVCQPTREDRW